MEIIVSCPSCSQPQRISTQRLGKEITCLACRQVYQARPSSKAAKVTPPDKDKPPQQADAWAQLGHRLWGNSAAVLDGVIPGVLSGIVVGLLIGFLYLGDEPQSAEALQRAMGASVSRAMLGMFVGFGLGAVMGTMATAAGRLLRGGQTLKRGWAAVFTGALTGPTLALIVADYRWCLWGLGFGAGVASLWPLLCSKVEAALADQGYKKTWDEKEHAAGLATNGFSADGRVELLPDTMMKEIDRRRMNQDLDELRRDKQRSRKRND